MKIEAQVCERLLRDKVIREEEKEIIQYGLHQGGVLFVNICTLMIVCTTMGCVIQGFWFLVCFWPLRIYAGGYHADTEKRCYFLSTLMEIVIFFIAHFFDFTRGMGVILITFTLMVIIFSMTPQDTENRRLSDKEKTVYKKKVNEILVFHIISFAMMYLIDKKEIWEIILLSEALMAFILIVGYMKEILNSKENENATTKAC